MYFNFVFTFALSLFLSNVLFAQSFVFEEEPLPIVFEKIENETSFTFNFDPEILKDFSFDGKIEVEESFNFIKILLAETNLEYDLSQDKILIFLPPKKTFTICGHVYSGADQTQLSYVNIVLLDYLKGDASDQDGYYEFSCEAYGNEMVQFSYLGFQSQEIRLSDWGNGECKTIYLQEKPIEISKDIVITDYLIRGISEGEKYGSLQVDYKRLSKYFIDQEHDVLLNIQHLPGITSSDESASNLNIRGSAPDQNLILWEKAILYNPGHFFGMISAINPFVVQDVNIYKGVYPSKMGNAIGGIVDIQLNDEIVNKFHGGVGFDMTKAHVHSELPLIKNKLSVILGGRASLSGIFLSPTINNYASKIFQDGFEVEELEEEEQDERDESDEIAESLSLDDAELNFYDFNAKVVFKPISKLKIKSAYLQSHNFFEYESRFEDDQLGNEEELLFDSHLLSTEVSLLWNSNQKTDFYHIFSEYKSSSISYFKDDDESSFAENSQNFNNIIDHQLGVTHAIKKGLHWDFEMGYTFEKKEVNYEIIENSLFEGDYLESDNSLGNFHNIFASASYKKNDLSGDIGLRSVYYNELGTFFHSPRLNLQYLVKPSVKLKFSAGQFYQFASKFEMFDGGSLDAYRNIWFLSSEESGNVLKSNKLSGGFVFRKNKWLVDVEGYYHKNTGISQLSTTYLFDNANGSIGESEILGLDFMINKSWTNYKFWVNYTLSKNQARFPEVFSNAFPSNNDQRHNLSVVNNMNFGKFNLSMTYNFRSGLPFSNPSGIEEVEVEDLEYYNLKFDQINNFRSKNYHRLDAKLSYKTNMFREDSQLEMSFSLLNILNNKNLGSRTYYIGEIEEDDDLELISFDKYLLSRTTQFLIRYFW